MSFVVRTKPISNCYLVFGTGRDLPINLEKHRHTYSNGEITVIWQPLLCAHTGICLRGLPGVFDRTRIPWVDIHAAPTDEIRNQVERCPSGALSYVMREDGEIATSE